jgi:hypothetical protein
MGEEEETPTQLRGVMMLEHLHAVTFGAQLHTSFRVLRSSEPTVEVELVEVTERNENDGKQLWATARQERFSILFRGARNPALQQGMYRLLHDELGDLELFLVPAGQDQNSVYYEAVFNRLWPADA